jgi:hypothetical protein
LNKNVNKKRERILPERRCSVSIIISKESDDLYVVHVSGLFTYEDLKGIENGNYGIKGIDKKVNILITTKDFQGWGKEGNWGDLTFMYEADPHINKIAIVAEGKWKDQLLMYLGAGRRQAAVEFFLDGDEKKARDWLQSENQ